MWRHAFLVLDFGFDVFGDVRRHHSIRNGQGLHMKICMPPRRRRVDSSLDGYTVRVYTTILELLTAEDQTLLIWWGTMLVLNLGFQILEVFEGSPFRVEVFPVQVRHQVRVDFFGKL